VDYNPFHDVKIPKVPGQRAIKVATPQQYLTVRACLPTKPVYLRRLDDGQVRRADITVTARPATTGEAGARWR
jgi:hypothetical protein